MRIRGGRTYGPLYQTEGRVTHEVFKVVYEVHINTGEFEANFQQDSFTLSSLKVKGRAE